MTFLVNDSALGKGFDPSEARASNGEWTTGTAKKYGWTKEEHAAANANARGDDGQGDLAAVEANDSSWAHKKRAVDNGWSASEAKAAFSAEGEEDGMLGYSDAWHGKHQNESWYKNYEYKATKSEGCTFLVNDRSRLSK